MNDYETLLRAKQYIDMLAKGINPLDNTPIDEGEVINNVRISRCLHYVSDILGKVIDNGGKVAKTARKLPPFFINNKELAAFSYSDEPVGITEITKRINYLTDTSEKSSLSFTKITKWLVDIEFLREEVLSDGKKRKLPTDMGRRFGIITEERNGPSGDYTAVLYTKEAQRFIIDNLNAVTDVIFD
ncbi:MAG: hypothetical protein E7218_05450 [Anaerofustis stercorihominis]|nr:hypothetical protein [Anaerofustis stercorihominis]